MTELLKLSKKSEALLWQKNANEQYRKGKYGYAIGYSLLLSASVHEENTFGLNQLYDFANKNYIERNGCIKELIEELVLSKKESKLDSYLEFIFYKSINDHVYSSFQKFSLGQAEVQTFLLEDSHVRFLRPIHPSPTTPRLQRLHGFLLDLKLIEENRLSSKGIEILNQ